MPETSIAGVQESYISDINAMTKATEAFTKDVEKLEAALHKLNKGKVSLEIDTKAALKGLKDAQKQFIETGKETDKLKMKAAQSKYDVLKQSLDSVTKKAKETESQIKRTGESIRKAANSSGGYAKGMFNALASSGVGDEAKKVLADGATAFVSSALGSDAGMIFSSILSTAASGAVAGASFGGPVGALIGGAVGAGVGLISGGLQKVKNEEEALKEHAQEQYSALQEKRTEELKDGISGAEGRERDLATFAGLLEGKDDPAGFLGELEALAKVTPLLYSDLTELSKAMLNQGVDTGGIITAVKAAGEAGTAKGMGMEDIKAMAAALGQMSASEKASMEPINELAARGFDVMGWLGKAGITAEKIANGGYSGKQVAEIIQSAMMEAYGGSMQSQAETHGGLASTLEGWKQEMNRAEGNAYNEAEKKNIQAGIAFYEGGAGDALAEMNAFIGEGKALAENLAGQYEREAMSALLTGETTTLYEGDQAKRLQAMNEEYLLLKDRYAGAGDDEKAILSGQIEALKNEAEGMAKDAYAVSDVAKGLQEAERDQYAALRENTAALEAWRAAYEMEQEQTKGWAAGLSGSLQPAVKPIAFKGDEGTVALLEKNVDSMGYIPLSLQEGDGAEGAPYNSFPALFHEGGRGSAAHQAREVDRGEAMPIQVTMTGNTFYGSDQQMEERIARKIAAEVRRATLLAAP